jgi:hypothetical protein
VPCSKIDDAETIIAYVANDGKNLRNHPFGSGAQSEKPAVISLGMIPAAGYSLT